MDKEVSATHLSCGCDWDGKRWFYCAQHECPDDAPCGQLPNLDGFIPEMRELTMDDLSKRMPPDAASPEVPLELRPIDAGHHYLLEKKAVELDIAREKAERLGASDAAPPKEVLQGIEEAARNEGRYLNDDELEPPPSDAAQQAVKLLALKDNWDSYGARIISKIAVDAALRLRDVLAVMPSLVPTSCGGVQLEWHSQGFDVELEIEPNGRLAHPEDAPGGPWIDFSDLNPHRDGMTIGVTTSVIGGLFAGQRGKVVDVDYGTQKARFELALNQLKGDEK